MKYRYWHVITKSFDKRFPKGEVLGEKYIIDHPYEIFNMKTGNSKVVCHLKYLCRLDEKLNTNQKLKILKEKIKKLFENI